MPGFVAGTGTLTYNGITFPNQITAKVESRPITDSAGRFTKATQHTLTVETIFHDPTGLGGNTDLDSVTTSLDANYPNIRQRLLQAGGALVFNQKGFGADFSVNTNISDVQYGPKPEVLVWEPIGDNKAIHCVWTVTVVIPPCESTSNLKLMELNYSMTWDISEMGLTRRTISGTMELAANRANPSVWTINRTVDNFRERFRADIPIGYKRSQRWSISPDKRTALFNINDEEIPSNNPYFPGVIRPSVTYDVSNTNRSMRMWDCSLSGNIEVAKGYPKWYAWAAFLLVLRDKRNAAQAARWENYEGEQKSGKIVMTTRIQIADEVFGLGMRFSVQWLLHCNLKSLLQGSGMWVPVNSNWAEWNRSMSRQFSSRGVAGMKHLTSDDAIVEMCNGPQSINVNSAVNQPSRGSLYEVFADSCPSPESSWINFQNDVYMERDTQTMAHQTLTRPQTGPSPGQSNLETMRVYDLGELDTSTGTFEHRRASSQYKVIMEGYAERICYPVPNMELKKYGGSDVIPVGKPFQSHKLIRKMQKGGVYFSTWRKEYVCKRKPSGSHLEYPDNINPDKFS